MSAAKLQRLSKVLFGQQHRLAVMLEIADSDGVINPGDIADALGFRAQSSIQNPIRDLESAGLISRLPVTGGKAYYQRNDSLVWAWVKELVERIDAAGVADPSQQDRL